AVPVRAGLGQRPVPGEQRTEQGERLRGGGCRAGRAAVPADRTAQRRRERPVRTRGGAPGTLGERGGPAADRQRAQQVGVQDQGGRVALLGERGKRAGQQQVLLGGRFAGDLGEPPGGLHHGGGSGVAGIVPAQRTPVRGEGLHLGDHVQVPAGV